MCCSERVCDLFILFKAAISTVSHLLGAPPSEGAQSSQPLFVLRPTHQTKNLHFRGFESSRFLISRGGIPMSRGISLRNLDSEILSLQIPDSQFAHGPSLDALFGSRGFEAGCPAPARAAFTIEALTAPPSGGAAARSIEEAVTGQKFAWCDDGHGKNGEFKLGEGGQTGGDFRNWDPDRPKAKQDATA